MRYFKTLFLLFGTIALIGCNSGPYELAAVSGVVTLDGQPLANASVSFEPRGGESEIVGPGSIGTTDDSGAFSLKTFKDERGAVVGNHVVRISTFKSKFADLRTSDNLEIISEERVPAQYNRNTQISFDVPSGGTDEANFELKSK